MSKAAGPHPPRSAAKRAKQVRPLGLLYAASVIIVSGLLVLVPGVWPGQKDSFPLSTYPMFAKKRGRPKAELVVGIDKDNREHKLSPEIFGTSEVLQAKVLVRKALRRGKKHRRRFCRDIAQRVAEHQDYQHVVRLELLRARYDPIKYFVESPKPIQRKVLTRCPVSRSRGAQQR